MVGNKELTNYIRSIQKNMNCSSENKKRFLEELESDIREDIQKNPDMSYKDIIGKYVEHLLNFKTSAGAENKNTLTKSLLFENGFI